MGFAGARYEGSSRASLTNGSGRCPSGPQAEASTMRLTASSSRRGRPLNSIEIGRTSTPSDFAQYSATVESMPPESMITAFVPGRSLGEGGDELASLLAKVHPTIHANRLSRNESCFLRQQEQHRVHHVHRLTDATHGYLFQRFLQVLSGQPPPLDPARVDRPRRDRVHRDPAGSLGARERPREPHDADLRRVVSDHRLVA